MSASIDKLIGRWKEYLIAISQNMLELDDLESTKYIKSKVSVLGGGFTGVTKERAILCMKNLSILWEYYSLLSALIDHACVLAGKNGLLNNVENEVKELFEGKSIIIKGEYISVETRGLLDNSTSDVKVTPLELLNYMEESFKSVGIDVAEIYDATENMQNRLSGLILEIDKLNSRVSHLGLSKVPVFDINKVSKIESDPMKGLMELDKLVYDIEKYRASIHSVEQDYDDITKSMSNITNMLSELKALATKSKTVINEVQKKFGEAQFPKPIINEEILDSLQEWLRVLENKLPEGNLTAIKVGICKLEQECNLKLEIEKDNYYSNTKDYNEWLDLKGQFQALIAKGKVLRDRGALFDNSLEDLMDNIRIALYAATVELNNCRQLIRRLELKLTVGGN